MVKATLSRARPRPRERKPKGKHAVISLSMYLKLVSIAEHNLEMIKARLQRARKLGLAQVPELERQQKVNQSRLRFYQAGAKRHYDVNILLGKVSRRQTKLTADSRK